jgi:hypothetical protein
MHFELDPGFASRLGGCVNGRPVHPGLAASLLAAELKAMRFGIGGPTAAQDILNSLSGLS